MKNKLLLLTSVIFLLLPFFSAGSLFGSGNYGADDYGIGTTVTPPGGGGGGGGGTYQPLECIENTDCAENQYCSENKCFDAECFDDSVCDTEKSEACWNYQCVKLFDVEIKDFESPAKLEDFFDFTYLIKGMANISGDVIINFWIENENTKVTSGSDTIYLGSFEEKTKTTKMYLPSTAESGVYEFYVEVSFEDYKAKSHRIIEIKVDQEKGIATITKKPKLTKYLIYGLIALAGILALIILIVLLRKIKFQRIKEKIFTKRILWITIITIITAGVIFLGTKYFEKLKEISSWLGEKLKIISIKFFNLIIKFFSQKEILMGTIIGIILLLGVITIVVIIKKRKEKEQAFKRLIEKEGKRVYETYKN